MTDKLNVLESCRDALVAGCCESVEVDGHIAVIAAAALHRVEYRLHMTVNDLRCVLRCRIKEEMTCVVLVIGTVNIAVVHISGKCYPGFKVVEGRSNRRYTDTDTVAAAVIEAGYDPFEKKLMGVTAMTKLLGAKKFNTLLGSLIEKPKGKPTLVPESDKRPAWTIDDFKEETENE